MYLSKSKYVQVWSCPKGAWIQKYRPDLAATDANTTARLRTGDEVGDLARGLFGPSVNVTAYREDGSLGLPRMIYEKLGDSAKGIVRKCLYPAVLVLFAVSLVEVINGNYSPFIYFRF